MTIINPVRQKWIASVTCTAAAICTVFAGIGQQVTARLIRHWDLSIEMHVGFGVIVGLFLFVILLNVIRFAKVDSDLAAFVCTFFSVASVLALFVIMLLQMLCVWGVVGLIIAFKLP